MAATGRSFNLDLARVEDFVVVLWVIRLGSNTWLAHDTLTPAKKSFQKNARVNSGSGKASEMVTQGDFVRTLPAKAVRFLVIRIN